jgi:hypothetical protein
MSLALGECIVTVEPSSEDMSPQVDTAMSIGTGKLNASPGDGTRLASRQAISKSYIHSRTTKSLGPPANEGSQQEGKARVHAHTGRCLANFWWTVPTSLYVA